MDETILNARYGNVNPFSDKPNMIEQSVSLVKTPEVKQHCIQRDSYRDGPCWNMPDCLSHKSQLWIHGSLAAEYCHMF